MKTLLFTPMYIDGEERFERHIKWSEYFSSLDIKYNETLFVDNYSKNKTSSPFIDNGRLVNIHRCERHLKRITHNAYGYWYRAFRIGIEYAIKNNFDKIVHIDTDTYLLNKNICDYINEASSGWTGFWCEMYGFPETALQIICKDQFDKAREFFTDGFLEYYPYDIAENKIPFTHVEKKFKGDRYGEKRLLQTPDMDYYCQANNETQFTYNMTQDVKMTQD